VTGTGITGSVNMAEETRTDNLGDAWTFSLTDTDIANAGGSVNGTYTAHFNFAPPIDPPTTNAFQVSIAAFALGEAEATEAIPAPAALPAGLVLLGLVALRRRR